MGQNTAIEWAHHTFNPWVGCTKVSPACDHCYAEGWAKRTGQAHLWQGERRRTSEANWRQPLRWNKRAALGGRRLRVFCASLADVFDNQVPVEWLTDLIQLIRATPSLDWLLLTKRPQLIRRRLTEACGDAVLSRWLHDWFHNAPPPNVWLGTTAENQAEADRRIPHLLCVPARVRFLSCEPLLGGVDIARWLDRHDGGPCPVSDPYCEGEDGDCHDACEPMPHIGWVICGGESGSGARPMRPEWARGLRDQCDAAGVPFFFKQWGDHLPEDEAYRLDLTVIQQGPPPSGFYRVGKRAAGRLLDGRLHDEFPHAP